MMFSLVSAAFLLLAFPRFNLWPFAWVAFVPVLYQVARGARFRTAFFHFYAVGFLFFLLSCEWLRHVTYFGWLFVSVSYAIYFACFGLAVRWFLNQERPLLTLFALPSAWVSLEWIRTEIPDWGFGWNLLAYSQSENLGVAQIASALGAYGVSWVILFANLSLFFLLELELRKRKKDGVAACFSISVLAVVLGLAFSLPLLPAHQTTSEAESVRLAVIQANVPQKEKWIPENRLKIIELHEKLSRFISFEEKPDLFIWPEAAYPGYFNIDPNGSRLFQLSGELKVPILFGSPYLNEKAENRELAFNSALLINDRDVLNRYDKIRLVAFGEYVPWRWLFGPIGLERLAYTFGVSDFIPGAEMDVFSLMQKIKFSVLICFEDTFPFLAREAVRKGAQFLVVITNDAWFEKSAAPYQHLQASVFRAIENGVPVIRSANTGISAFIGPDGEVLDRVKDKRNHDSFVVGGLARRVELNRVERTFYQKLGFWFPMAASCLFLMALFFGLKTQKRNPEA